MPQSFVVLLVAISVEVAATAALPLSRGFRAPGWTAVVVTGYLLSIWLLTIVVRGMDVSVAYAIWAGLGTAAIAVVGVAFLHERFDWVKGAAIALIVVGVVLLNLDPSAHGHGGDQATSSSPQ